MTKREELELFIVRANELIESKYILADVKIVNLLKSIAGSETLIAILKNCLSDFDYEQAKKKYLVKNKYFSDDKGEFVMPPSSRELLAFVFNVLMDIDAKRVELADFINKYFYEDGSFSSGYEAFINLMIKPFKEAVKMLMEGVVEGTLQDPEEALEEAQKKKEKLVEEKKKQEKIDKELSKKAYGQSIKRIKEILLSDKTKIRASSIDWRKKEDIMLVIDMLANVLDSEDRDAIDYAFTAYRYLCKAYPLKLFGRIKKVGRLLQDVYHEI